MSGSRPHILIVGGGFVGLNVAKRLQKRLSPGEATVTLVDNRPYMTYAPFLPEAAAGNIDPANVIVPLRQNLKRTNVVTANVDSIDHAARTAHVTEDDGSSTTISYDQLVFCAGAVPRTLPIPGLAEEAIGFKRVEEALYLHNHVLQQIDIGSSTDDPAERRRALTFVFVGGGYAGIEALAELEDMAKDATGNYPNLSPSDLNFVLIEALGRILPEVGDDMGRWTLGKLRERGIECKLETFLQSCVDKHIICSDGSEFDTNTLVWTAGVKPNPLVNDSSLPLDERGRLKAKATLESDGAESAWVAGDCAAVPDLTKNPGDFCGPSAQHAVRQAPVLADNIVATLRGEPLTEYRHAYSGSVAGLGLYKGVASTYGVKVKGFPAWLMHRFYHGGVIPTADRKARVFSGWILNEFFGRDTVTLGAVQDPFHDWKLFAVPPKKKDEPKEKSVSGPQVGAGQ